LNKLFITYNKKPIRIKIKVWIKTIN
jgi:hypothetical protein